MNTVKYSLVFLLLLVFSLPGYTQDLKINDIFNDVGKQKGTMIQLGTDILSPHTNIILYKSLRIKTDTELSDRIENALREDTHRAESLLIREDESGKTMHYKLAPHNDNSSVNEYILFQQSKGYISLIYLKGNFLSKDLKKELDKLKDLFIKLK